jgi:sodium-dependent phosphate cotransporter
MLVLFLFALELMISSFHHLGNNAEEMILVATANPFAALFIGLLITAMIQSSSTTTALTVALVASGSITLESAIPIIMGANVGTTITSTIVALSFINKRKEFKRAVAAGTYHDFFNILTVLVLFPLEYYYGFLSSASTYIANYFFDPSVRTSTIDKHQFWLGFDPAIDFLTRTISNGFILATLSFALLFASIILFRKLISNILAVHSPERFSRFFFKNDFKSFLWGLGITAAIRSSTVTTSLVVPIAAKKIISLRKAVPFIIGANIGTTITAFMAALLNSNTSSGISIALTHFLFNLIGALIFFPTPALRKVPIKLANELAKLTAAYKPTIFIYVLATFFFVPFSLIYLHHSAAEVFEAHYRKTDMKHGNGGEYRIICRMGSGNKTSDWLSYQLNADSGAQLSSKVFTVSKRKDALFLDNEMYLFNSQGTCWDGAGEQGKYKMCIQEILPEVKFSPGLSADSVYVYKKNFYDSVSNPMTIRYFVSAHYPLLLKKETWDSGNRLIAVDEIISLEKK